MAISSKQFRSDCGARGDRPNFLIPAFAGVDVEVGEGEQGVDVPRVVVQQRDEVVGVVARPRALERPLRIRVVRIVHVPGGGERFGWDGRALAHVLGESGDLWHTLWIDECVATQSFDEFGEL